MLSTVSDKYELLLQLQSQLFKPQYLEWFIHEQIVFSSGEYSDDFPAIIKMMELMKTDSPTKYTISHPDMDEWNLSDQTL